MSKTRGELWNQYLRGTWGDWLPTVPAVLVAAAETDGKTLLVGARHYDMAMHSQMEAIGDEEKIRKFVAEAEDGFIDQFCQFYNREEGMKLAKDTGQFNRTGDAPAHLLFSEDLW